MEQVLLGIAGASAADAGNLLSRSSQAVLEPFADILHAVANSFSSQEHEVEEEAKSHEAMLTDRIQKALNTAGIEITEPLELTVRDGKLSVESDHPQRALIEATLAQDPTLADDLSRLLEGSESASAVGGDYFSLPNDSQRRIAEFSIFGGEPRLKLL